MRTRSGLPPPKSRERPGTHGLLSRSHRAVMRLARIATGVLLAAGAVAAMVFVIVVAGQSRAPSAAECVDDWNARAGQARWDQIAAGQFRSAIVRGWLAKLEYPGCGIIFITAKDGPWLSCSRSFHAVVARLTEWGCEGGSNWGSDASPNATLRATHTRLELIDRGRRVSPQAGAPLPVLIRWHRRGGWPSGGRLAAGLRRLSRRAAGPPRRIPPWRRLRWLVHHGPGPGVQRGACRGT